MQKLLIATSNPGKLGEYRTALADLGLELVSLKDVGLGSIEETGATFQENAELKARTYFELSGLPCISDDGGLEIDALGGLPGVKSRRWKTGDENVTDEELVEYTLEQMKQVPEGKRGARLTLVAAFFDGKEIHTTQASIEGEIAHGARDFEPGFPFRALLYVTKFGKMYDDLLETEHEEVNHRRIAVSKLKPVIRKSLGGRE